MNPKTKTNALSQFAAAAIVLCGLVIFTRGVWLAWRPGGWMVAGLTIALPAFFWLYSRVRKDLAGSGK